MLFLYQLLLSLLILITLPLWLYRYFSGDKYRLDPGQRFGRLSASLRADLAGRPCFWVHAVSVGEVQAAAGLVARLHAAFPDLALIVTTVTLTGRKVAQERFPFARHILFLPIDLPLFVEPVVEAISPRFLLVMETELWPTLFAAMERRRIPVLVANGRLSARSFRGYRKARPFMARFLRPVTCFAMQSEADAARIRQLAGSAARVLVTGNIKYDQALVLPEAEEMDHLRRRLGTPAGPLLIAASTHPGEEAIVLRVFVRLRAERADLRLILVPRHPERSAEVSRLVAAVGLSMRLFSRCEGEWPEAVLLVDGVGWLKKLYGVAQAAYVGGSLIPHGGQNPLEPAAWGLAPVFGPHMFNFRDVVGLLLDGEGAIQVDDEDALAAALARLLRDEAESRRMGACARAVVAANTGALERCLTVIQEGIAQAGTPSAAKPQAKS